MTRRLVAALAFAALMLCIPAPSAATRPTCENGYGGVHPLPASGCLKLNTVRPTLADLGQMAEEWQVPDNATVQVVPVRVTGWPAGGVEVTFKWTAP